MQPVGFNRQHSMPSTCLLQAQGAVQCNLQNLQNLPKPWRGQSAQVEGTWRGQISQRLRTCGKSAWA